MENFASWFDLLMYLEYHTIVHYQAPMDLHPVPVCVIKKYKNGKIKLQYRDMKFTVDKAHTSRFRRKCEACPHLGE